MRISRPRGVLVSAVVLGLALAAQVTPANAHEQHQVGKFTVEMGWRDEPALEGILNAVYLEGARDSDRNVRRRPDPKQSG